MFGGYEFALTVHIYVGIFMICRFVIRFFIAHLRRHNFPMDRAMFEGSEDFEAARHERPAWIARLGQSRELEGALVAEAMPAKQVIHYVFGFAAVAAGLFFI